MDVQLTELDHSQVEVEKNQIPGYVSGSLLGQRQAKRCVFKFIGSTWGSVKSFKGETCISSPKELLQLYDRQKYDRKN